MATPTQPERRGLAAGAVKGATWGTAAATGAGKGLSVQSISGFVRAHDYLQAKDADMPFSKWGALDVCKPIDFTLGGQLLYDPGILGTLFALFFGTAGAPTQQGATTAYKHTLQFADTLWGKFATVAVEFPGKIYECASAKPMELGFKIGNGGFVEFDLKCRGNKLIDDSAVNTATQMDALTYVNRTARALFKQSAVRMNAESGATLEGATPLTVVNSIELSFKRMGFDAVYSAGTDYIVEPAEGGHPDVRVKLSFARMNAENAAFFAAAVAETTQKLTLTLTSNEEAGAAYPYVWKFYFPRLRMLHPDASWEEITKNGLELVAEEAASNPTGMSYARPYAEVTNKQATDYLA